MLPTEFGLLLDKETYRDLGLLGAGSNKAELWPTLYSEEVGRADENIRVAEISFQLRAHCPVMMIGT